MSKQKIPVWVKEYFEEIDKLRKKTKSGEIYSGNQSKLEVLKKTGRGNCVAMSNLFIEILKKHEVNDAYRVQIAAKDKRENFDHRVTIVVEGINKFWFQSNEELTLFDDFIQLIKHASKEMNWMKKGFFIRRCQIIDWC